MTKPLDAKRFQNLFSVGRQIDKIGNPIPPGPVGVVLRVTLAIVFMYLIVISFEMLGIAGPLFISVLFLIAIFVPLAHDLYHTHRKKPQPKETRERQRSEQRTLQEATFRDSDL